MPNEHVKNLDSYPVRVELPRTANQLAALWDWNEERLRFEGEVIDLEVHPQNGGAILDVAAHLARLRPDLTILIVNSALLTLGDVLDGHAPVIAPPAPALFVKELNLWVGTGPAVDRDLLSAGYDVVIRETSRQDFRMNTRHAMDGDPEGPKDQFTVKITLSGVAPQELDLGRPESRFRVFNSKSLKLTNFKKHAKLNHVLGEYASSLEKKIPPRALERSVAPAVNWSPLEEDVALRAFAFRNAKNEVAETADGVFDPSELPSLIALLRERLTPEGFEALDALLKDSPNQVSVYQLVKTAQAL